MSMPRVTRLRTTPVKGFALHEVDQIDVDHHGAVGDRDFFMVADDRSLVSITRIGTFASWRADFDPMSDTLTLQSADGRTLTDKAVLGEPIEGQFYDDRTVSGHVVAGPWTEWLSELAGRPVTLVRAEEPGEAYDVHPVTILADESVGELGRHAPDGWLDTRRFRMLIGFDGVAPYTEDTWNGHQLRIGTSTLRVRGGVPRCNATTRHPDTGVRDVQTLALIEQHRGRLPNDSGEGLNLGVYADVVSAGTIAVGDELHLE